VICKNDLKPSVSSKVPQATYTSILYPAVAHPPCNLPCVVNTSGRANTKSERFATWNRRITRDLVNIEHKVQRFRHLIKTCCAVSIFSINAGVSEVTVTEHRGFIFTFAGDHDHDALCRSRGSPDASTDRGRPIEQVYSICSITYRHVSQADKDGSADDQGFFSGVPQQTEITLDP
jgi:hypothetical protein